jgi:hypothetical protein
LVSLGLDETPELLAAPKKQAAPGKRRKADAGGGSGSVPPPEPRQPPSRQSKRQRGEAPEITPLRREQRRERREQRRDRRDRAEESEEEDGLPGRRKPRNAAAEHRAQRQSVKADKGDVEAHHDLNNYRWAFIGAVWRHAGEADELRLVVHAGRRAVRAAMQHATWWWPPGGHLA